MMSGMPERAPYLDQFTAGRRNLLAVGDTIENQQHRCGIVVHDRCRLGARQAAQLRLKMIVALAALSASEIKFKIGGLSSGLRDRFDRDIRKTGATKVRMQHRPGQIEDATQ